MTTGLTQQQASDLRACEQVNAQTFDLASIAASFASLLKPSNGAPRLTGLERIEGFAMGDGRPTFVSVDIIPYSVTRQHWWMRFVDRTEAWLTKRPVNDTGVYAMMFRVAESHCPGEWKWTYQRHDGNELNPWPEVCKTKLDGFIYFIYADDLCRLKIGYSAFPASRIDCLQTGSPCDLKLLGSIPGTQKDERKLHSQFKATRVTGEWFDVSPALREYVRSAIGDKQASCVKCRLRG